MLKRLLCALLALVCIWTCTSCAAPEKKRSLVGTDACNWYEVFVYSYYDSNDDGIGDLNGLYEKLDYITSLGYNGLWLMPIMSSPSYHKYDVTDYCSVDPQYGTLEDMRKLVARCHELGVRIIIDMPINHTSTRHPWFLSACESLQKRTEDSPYLDYYHFTQEQKMDFVPLNGTKWFYEEQFAGGNMPDLNLENPDVLAEIQKIFAFWLEDVGVDGFRLDAVTSYVASNTQKNVEILRKINQMAKEIKPDCYLVGEAWTSLGDIAAYYESGIDSFFLFPVAQAEGYVVKSILGRSKNASSFVSRMEGVYEAIPDGVLAPFLCNHDTGRTVVALQARTNPDRVKFAHGLVNMMGGNAFTYYGDEIGMVGSGDDPNKRLPMYWNDEDMTAQPPGVTQAEYVYPCVDAQLKDDASILNYLKKVNEARLDHPLIARGENAFVYTDDNVCVMQRTRGEESLYIAVNFSPKNTCTLSLNAGKLQIGADLEVGTEKASLFKDGENTGISLPPYAIVVLKH